MIKLLSLSFLLSMSLFAQTMTIEERLNKYQVYLGEVNRMINANRSVDTTKLYNTALKTEVIGQGQQNSNQLRSRAYNIYSGLIGLYSKVKKSASAGKKAFYANKTALKLYSQNVSACLAYGKSLIGVHASPWAWIAKRNLGISGSKFTKEVRLSISYLEKIEQTTDVVNTLRNLKRIL